MREQFFFLSHLSPSNFRFAARYIEKTFFYFAYVTFCFVSLLNFRFDAKKCNIQKCIIGGKTNFTENVGRFYCNIWCKSCLNQRSMYTTASIFFSLNFALNFLVNFRFNRIFASLCFTCNGSLRQETKLKNTY
jgi:hypothetical protein